eukprot:scaffold32585_cov83-Phaeocystis_antarctica.AAC.4
MLTINATLAGGSPDGFDLLAHAALYFVTAGAIVPTLHCRGDRGMQPRPALRRVWAVIRLYFLGRGVVLAGFNIAYYVQGSSNYVLSNWAAVAYSVTCLLFAALATPRNRGRTHRRLGRLGERGTEEEEAAAVAALVGGSDPDAALERASNLLRCLPAPAGCTPRTSQTTRLRHQQGRRFTRARSRRRWGK